MGKLDALYDAAIAGNADAIAKLEMEADKLKDNGETILHVESRQGNTQRVRFILRQFANKNLLAKVTYSKYTALHLAIYNRHAEVAEVLVDAAKHLPSSSSSANENGVTSFQAFLRQGDKDMDTALHVAVARRNVAMVKLLVEADPTDRHIQNNEGKTPIYIAVEQGFNDILEIISTTCTAPSSVGPDGTIVVRIRNLDQGTSQGGTRYKIMDRYVLYVVALGGNTDAIAELEMNTDIPNEGEETILDIESQNRYEERLRFILMEFARKYLLVKLNSEEQTALHLAAYAGHTEVAKILIDAARHLPPSEDDNTHDNPVTSFQAFLRQADEREDTALHVAVKNGHDCIVKLIVEADPSDTHNQNRKGRTPMYIAVEKGFNDIVDIISTTCAAPSLEGPDGTTAVRIKNLDQGKSHGGTRYKIMDRYALYVAAVGGNTDAIAELEMQTDILSEGEETIIDGESQNKYEERLRFILREFARKHLFVKLNSQGQTALHLAAYAGHTEVAEILVDAARHLLPSEDDNTHDNPVTSFQAFLWQADKYENTALHVAVKNSHDCIVKLIVEADPNDTHNQNNRGKTPMYLAAERGLNHIVEIITTTCTAPSLEGPDGTTVVLIKNLDQAKIPGGALYKIVDKDALYADAIAGDAGAIAVLDMRANKLNEFSEETILHTESQNGNTERVRFILSEFAAKNLLVKLDKLKNTALHLAAEYGYTEVAEVLIDAARHLPPLDDDNTHDNPITSFQAFLRQADYHEDTALHRAVTYGYVDIVKLLVEADPSDTHTQNYQGETPMYIAVERGYYDIVKMICTTRTAPPNLDAHDGSTTILHILIKNFHKVKTEDRDVIKLIIEAFKRPIVHWDEIDDSEIWLFELFNRTDENGCTVLELAVERNYLQVAELILAANPAYHGRIVSPDHILGIMPLIHEADDKENNQMVELLVQTYKRGFAFVPPDSAYADVPQLIFDIGSRRQGMVLWCLNESSEAKHYATFADSLGWTVLHHAAYFEHDAVIGNIVEAQKTFGHSFEYQHRKSTPFHVAAKKGFTSTVILLMQLWPSSSSAYTAVDKNGQNILHIAALQSKKKMIQGILKYCREEYKNKLVNEQDNNGDTPLHLLIGCGCFVPELLRYEGLAIRKVNMKSWTPLDMLYFEDGVIGDQVQIKMALDGIQFDPIRDMFSSSVASKRERKDVIFYNQAGHMKLEKYAQIKEDTLALANCFAEAIAGNPISRAALEMEAAILNKAGETILHVEAKKGVRENVQFIVSELVNKSLLGKLDSSKQTALHLAAQHGHTKVVEVMVDAARRYNFPSSSANRVSSIQDLIRLANGQEGNTALHLAVLNGNVALVKFLVEADPNHSHVQNNEGKTPIYIAAENGYKDIVKEICMTCTALSLDGPGGRTTALHALIQNTGQVTEGTSYMIRMMVDAAKRWSNAEVKALFSRTDESGSTILQLAVEKNFVEAVKLILLEDPAYQPGPQIKRNSLMCLICKAIDNKYSDDIIRSLSETYKARINPDHEYVLDLILAIKSREYDSVLQLLENYKELVTFAEDNGWTPLHYAVYHEYDSILATIIEAQEEVSHQFVYENMESTPFYVAIEHGYTSTLIQLMQSWPPPSAVTAANSPYTIVNVDGRNILHLAAAANNKEMVQGILNYCPKICKEVILKQQDMNGDTPLHLLISNGCFIPELIKHKGLDTMAKNKKNFTPWDMLYFKNDVVAEQVHIKMALENIRTKQSAWNLWGKTKKKKTDSLKSNVVPESKRRKKDVIFNEKQKSLMDEEYEQKKKDSERYKMRTNIQIIVTALITTVTFTVGFTMRVVFIKVEKLMKN